jgi:hypothetical protein
MAEGRSGRGDGSPGGLRSLVPWCWAVSNDLSVDFSNMSQTVYLVLIVFCTCFLLNHVHSQTKTPVSCNLADICQGTSESPCSYNQPLPVVIEINNGTNSTYPSSSRFYTFCVNSDTFYSLAVLNSSDFMSASNDSYVRIWAGNIVSLAHYFNSFDLSVYSQFYTVLLNLNYGVVSAVDNSTGSNPFTFQNGCDYGAFGCLLIQGQPCLRSIDCGQYYSSTGKAQDVNVYLAFQGTATGNIPLRSANLLPANFRQYGLSTYFNAVGNLFVQHQ